MTNVSLCYRPADSITVCGGNTKEEGEKMVVIPKLCKCTNGMPARGEDCAYTAFPHCIGCYPGFHRNSDPRVLSCEPNICKCSFGRNAVGPECPQHQSLRCSECAEGFHMEMKVEADCVMNKCTCEHGQPAFGVTCPVSGQNWCRECEPGYTLNWSTGICRPAKCICL